MGTSYLSSIIGNRFEHPRMIKIIFIEVIQLSGTYLTSDSNKN